MARAWVTRQASGEKHKAPRPTTTGRSRPFLDFVKSMSDACGSPVSVATGEASPAATASWQLGTSQSPAGQLGTQSPAASWQLGDNSMSPRTFAAELEHERRSVSRGAFQRRMGGTARARHLEPLYSEDRSREDKEELGRYSSKKRGVSSKDFDSNASAASTTATTPVDTQEAETQGRTVTTVLSFREAVTLAKKHNLSISTVKSALDEFRDLGVGRAFLTHEELEQAMRRRCGLAVGAPIPAPLRAAALLSFEGHKVSFEEFLLWSQSTVFVEETLVPNPKERHLRQLARDHKCDFVMVETLMRLFRSFDTNNSGYIEWDEFRQVVCSMLKVKESTDISEARLLRYWKEADQSKTGRLNFEQFMVWYASNGTE